MILPVPRDITSRELNVFSHGTLDAGRVMVIWGKYTSGVFPYFPGVVVFCGDMAGTYPSLRDTLIENQSDAGNRNRSMYLRISGNRKSIATWLTFVGFIRRLEAQSRSWSTRARHRSRLSHSKIEEIRYLWCHPIVILTVTPVPSRNSEPADPSVPCAHPSCN